MKSSEHKIKIINFAVLDSYGESTTLDVNDNITFNVIWDIPVGIQLKGKVMLKLEGESNDRGKWTIRQEKDIKACSLLCYGECWFHKKIPEWSKPGSNLTATVKLKVDKHEIIEEVLSFKIKNKGKFSNK